MKTSMKQLVTENVEQEQQKDIAALTATNRMLTKTLAKQLVELGNRKQFVQQIIGSVQAAPPYSKFNYTHTQKTSSPVVPVLVLSDWHIGEVIEPNEVEGFNKYNWEIAQAGMLGIVHDFLQWVEIQRQFYPITECAVFCEGDYVSGSIHQELLATQEFPLPVQTANAGTLLGEVLRILAGHFSTVVVWECGADNHGRLQPKPQAKQKAANSMSFLVHHIANAYAGRCSNISFNIAEGMKQIATVNGRKFLLEHGDLLRGWAGLPWYAFTREVGREATRRMLTDRGFHFLQLGHYHTPCYHEGRVLVNSSLSGTSEFDHGAGRHALPGQIAYLIHKKWGLFNFTPFIRKDVKQNPTNL